MLRLKEGVRLNGLQTQMLFAAIVMRDVYGKYNQDCTITAGCDGKHKEYSSHYSGNALDFRTWAFTKDQLKLIVEEAQNSLGPDFLVLLEEDHIHVQYKPKASYGQ